VAAASFFLSSTPNWTGATGASTGLSLSLLFIHGASLWFGWFTNMVDCWYLNTFRDVVVIFVAVVVVDVVVVLVIPGAVLLLLPLMSVAVATAVIYVRVVDGFCSEVSVFEFYFRLTAPSILGR
jgi:hypothetical protein